MCDSWVWSMYVSTNNKEVVHRKQNDTKSGDWGDRDKHKPSYQLLYQSEQREEH